MSEKTSEFFENKNALNITNGDCFNDYFLKKYGGTAVPFCEDMMDGETITDICSDAFIDPRASVLNVSREVYRSKMRVCELLRENAYDEIRLWFGKDTFCQMNLLTLLAYLEQIGYGGRVVLHYIDDETFEMIEGNVIVHLGAYRRIYADIFIFKHSSDDIGVLDATALALYFDYHSDDGALARMVREHADKDDMALICLLLENSAAYGLSDMQAERLIAKYRNT